MEGGNPRVMPAPPAATPRTNHRLWAAGAAVLFLAIVGSSIDAARRPPAAPARPAAEAPAPAVRTRPPAQAAGTLPCGYCNGDGRIDEADKQRQAPRLEVPLGPCPACEGQGKH